MVAKDKKVTIRLSEETANKITRLNIRRLIIICGLCLVFLAVTLFSERFKTYKALAYVGLGLIGAISIVYGCVAIADLKSNILRGHSRKAVYLSYWYLIVLALIPFYIVDMRTLNSPICCIIFSCALVMVPVLSRRHMVMLFVINLTESITIAALEGAPPSAYIFLSAINFAGFLLSYNLHYDYTKLMSGIQLESDTDYLTGILNRRGGLDRVSNVWEAAKKTGSVCTAVMLDVDFFKDYNDKYGHPAGDRALARLAFTIRDTLSDAYVFSRIGGEEFLIFTSSRTTKEVIETAKAVRLAVNDLKLPAANASVAPYLSVSMGIASVIPHDRDDATTLVFAADRSLYKAKNQGRDRIFVASSIKE